MSGDPFRAAEKPLRFSMLWISAKDSAKIYVFCCGRMDGEIMVRLGDVSVLEVKT